MRKKRLFGLLILVISLGLIINLSRDIWRLLKSGDQISQAEEEVKTLEEKRQALLKKKEYYQSEEFIEEEAQNKLNMSRPEEIVVILPPNVKELVGRVEGSEAEAIPNWKKWWELFF